VTSPCRDGEQTAEQACAAVNIRPCSPGTRKKRRIGDP